MLLKVLAATVGTLALFPFSRSLMVAGSIAWGLYGLWELRGALLRLIPLPTWCFAGAIQAGLIVAHADTWLSVLVWITALPVGLWHQARLRQERRKAKQKRQEDRRAIARLASVARSPQAKHCAPEAQSAD